MPAIKTAGDSGSTTLISVKSNLMEDYRLAAAPPISEEYAVIFSAPNDPETFVVSGDGHVYDIYPDPASDTGYSVLDLAFPKTAARVAAAIASNGAITVFAAATDNSLWSLSYSTRPITQTWVSVALPSGPNSIYGLKAVAGPGGPCLLMSAGSSIPVMGPNIGLYMFSSGQWTGGPVQLLSQSRHCWCPATLADGSIGAFLITESVLWPYYSVCSGSFSTGAVTVQQLAQGNYTMVAAAPGSGGSIPFGLQPAVAGVPKPCGIYSITGLSQQITTTANVEVFAASSDASGIGELVGIASTGQLYHTQQDAAGSSTWSTFVPIGAQAGQTFLALQTVLDPDGNMRIIAVTTEYELYQIWQDSDTSDWLFEEIEFSLPGQIQPYTSYRTQITFYDNNDAPAANVQVNISTDQPVTMAINGVMTGLNPAAPWTGTADGSGRVVLSYQTNSIGVVALGVWSSFMGENDQIALDPSGPAQSTLASLSSDGTSLMQARVYDSQGNSTPLFTGTQSEAASISQAVLQAMTLTGINSAPQASRKYLHRNNDMRAARSYSVNGGAAPGQIDFANVPAQNWEVNFTSAGPQFENLSAEVAAHHRTARASLPRIEGILGFDCDWGDVMDMIVDGTVELVQFAVDKISSGIRTSITLTINAVNVVFETIVGWVRQAIDLIERIFDYIAVGFEQLFGWLGYLFNWTDILTVKDGIKFLFSQTFVLVSDLLQYLQQYISAWLTNFNTQIDGYFQSIIKSLGIQNVVDTQAEQPAPPVDAEALNSKNIVLSGFVNNADNASTPSATAKLTGTPGDPVSALIAALQAAAESYQEGGTNYNNFAQAITYFQNMGSLLTTQPDQALLNGIAGFVQTINAIAQAAVSTINTLISVILNALAAVVEAVGQTLAAAWTIPFVSDLYSYITNGGTLSALDLGALIIAIPVTIAYKLVCSDPLPDLTQYTAAKLASMLGVSSPKPMTPALAFAKRSPVADTWDAPDETTLRLVWLANYLGTGAYAWVNYKIDTTLVAGPAPTPPTPGTVALAVVNIITEMAVYVTGAPCWSLTAPSTMAVVAWSLGGLGISLDLATFKEGWQIQELNGDLGVILTTVVGAVYLVGNLVYCIVDGGDLPQVVDLVATMPEWSKILRLSIIASEPWGPAALKALGVIDVVCNVLPATFTLGYNWGTLSTSPRLNAAPAPA